MLLVRENTANLRALIECLSSTSVNANGYKLLWRNPRNQSADTAWIIAVCCLRTSRDRMSVCRILRMESIVSFAQDSFRIWDFGVCKNRHSFDFAQDVICSLHEPQFGCVWHCAVPLIFRCLAVSKVSKKILSASGALGELSEPLRKWEPQNCLNGSTDWHQRRSGLIVWILEEKESTEARFAQVCFGALLLAGCQNCYLQPEWSWGSALQSFTLWGP